MADDASLADRLEALIRAPDAQRRGYDFEQLVGDLFRSLHFTVIMNPGSASPRQVDLLATRGSEVYLIETKWLHDPANIEDVDNLYTRLLAVPGSVVGILISYSGFTDQVLARVKERSNTPVLLVSGSEIQGALLFNANLHGLLRRKQRVLLTDRDVLLDERASPPRKPVRRRRVTLPTSRTSFMFPGNNEHLSSIQCRGGFGQFAFVQEMPDIDWSAGSGLGVAADIPLAIAGENSLLELIHRLADLGWATQGARWSIQQASVNWHGIGAGPFIEELPAWRRRYEGHKPIHHSEELCYTDVCDGGFYTLTANVAAHAPRQVRYARLSFQLIGTPLDPTPLRDLCEAFDVSEPVYFRTKDRRSITRERFGPPFPAIEPIAILVEPEDHLFDDPPAGGPGKLFVIGLVIANPFRQESTLKLEHVLPHMVADSEYVVAALTEWHPVAYEPVSYHLTGLEYAWTSDGLLVRPAANWRRRNGRAPRRPTPLRAAPDRS